MDWQNTPQSTNIEDRRGAGGGVSLGGGGAGGLGIGAILIIGLISYFTGIDPRLLIGGAQIVTGSGSGTGVGGGASVGQPVDANDPQLILMKHVLGETEAVWTKVLPAQKNVRYTPATLVIYNGATDSGCGTAQAAMGPFYCPDDKKVYLDMAFFRDMQSKFGGGGDFAYAYVIAHEIGHHVQDLLGILGKVDDAKQSLSRTDANALSVRVELQADCLAGVWAANANQDLKLTQADVQQAIATAQAIGDDRLQTAARGYAVPDSFTHGSSAQRVQWLTTGLKSGQIDSCNTFAK
jgi:predicted metalloprotease